MSTETVLERLRRSYFEDAPGRYYEWWELDAVAILADLPAIRQRARQIMERG